jgi:predicted dehydrogenase
MVSPKDTAAASDTGARPGVAVIGCGGWGGNLARCFAGLGALAAVADRHPERAEALAARHGVPALTPEAAIALPGVTAVAVATSPDSHAALALRALAAGRHVFVEKPLALDLGEARGIAARARASGRVLMTGHVLRFHPAFRRLDELVRAGRLGRLLRIHASRMGPGTVRAQEDAMWCLAPHDVSMILALAGATPERVEARGEAVLRPDIADAATLGLGFASGLCATIHVSWLNPYKEQRLTVVGEAGAAVFDDRRDWPEKLMLYPGRATGGRAPVLEFDEPEAVAIDRDEPLLAECRHFLDCIATGRVPVTGPDEALAVMEVLTRAAADMAAHAPATEPA